MKRFKKHNTYILCQFAVGFLHPLGGSISFHSDEDHKQLPERISNLEKETNISKLQTISAPEKLTLAVSITS